MGRETRRIEEACCTCSEKGEEHHALTGIKRPVCVRGGGGGVTFWGTSEDKKGNEIQLRKNQLALLFGPGTISESSMCEPLLGRSYSRDSHRAGGFLSSESVSLRRGRTGGLKQN